MPAPPAGAAAATARGRHQSRRSCRRDGRPHHRRARWDEDGQRQLGESHLTREEALRLAAQSGHRLTWNKDRFGSLEVGKVADMAVLAEDPLTCDLDRLKDIRIERTFLGGRQVFGPI